jgi:hypothetical protein
MLETRTISISINRNWNDVYEAIWRPEDFPKWVFGVMDHYVDVGIGSQIYIPLRIIPNGDGAEVLLTLFRQPGMSDAKFEADAEWVERDLLSLKALVTL